MVDYHATPQRWASIMRGAPRSVATFRSRLPPDVGEVMPRATRANVASCKKIRVQRMHPPLLERSRNEMHS
jgi:hypothetical protein